MTERRRAVLLLLVKHAPLTFNQIAQRTDFSSHSLRRVLNHGWFERSKSLQPLLYTLSAEGRAQVDTVKPPTEGRPKRQKPRGCWMSTMIENG